MSKDYKDTNNKPPLNLIPPECYMALGEVLQYGIEKYGKENEGSYKHGEHDTYESALLRHLVDYKSGEWKDDESGLSHLKHVLFNAMAMVYIEERDSLEAEEDDINDEVEEDDIIFTIAKRDINFTKLINDGWSVCNEKRDVLARKRYRIYLNDTYMGWFDEDVELFQKGTIQRLMGIVPSTLYFKEVKEIFIKLYEIQNHEIIDEEYTYTTHHNADREKKGISQPCTRGQSEHFNTIKDSFVDSAGETHTDILDEYNKDFRKMVNDVFSQYERGIIDVHKI